MHPFHLSHSLHYHNINEYQMYFGYVFRGYIEAVREIEQQLDTVNDKIKFDDIVVACGRFCFSYLVHKNT